ncbi:ParB/RepB/Spo0J family partition protein [Phreatobacter stygius]|uniref:ParB-like N-terminal domain-containing protein n=1 Tax=Phreatobacter stygius TaxID=1940610 RepID=A0A4D7BC19_9HYPH|nr:ParB N-terminal domain-containing protein [Phreatobacter stygius]QCI65547.1 hypothetical protein E8M01_15825 [Phreatobacter stygius]
MMQGLIFPCPLAAIDRSGRLRPSDAARVEALAASMAEIGLQAPIIVRPGPDAANSIILVAGGHRVAAAERLGWTEIPAIRLDLSAAEARLVEIDENLIRHELTALDRAIFLAERKRIYESLHPEAAHGKARKGRKTEPRGDGKALGEFAGNVATMATFQRYSKDAAKRTGLSERVVQRAVELAGRLSPAIVAAIRHAPIADNQAELMALAALPADQQQACAEAIATGAARSVQAARIATRLAPPRLTDPDEQAFQRFVALWERGSLRLRRRIESHIGAGVIDLTAGAHQAAEACAAAEAREAAEACEATGP